MNEDQKIKLELFKNQMLEKKKQQKLLNNVLYQECLAALSDYEIMDDEDAIKELVHQYDAPEPVHRSTINPEFTEGRMYEQ
ncbi:MAG: hypothetical protein IJ619_01795 [Eubacterium sp.]|nr:hypothetical protein [Eubacterium sp.]